jgi:hypothetical protein
MGDWPPLLVKLIDSPKPTLAERGDILIDVPVAGPRPLSAGGSSLKEKGELDLKFSPEKTREMGVQKNTTKIKNTCSVTG